MPYRQHYAAIDLGSNSFHLLVARLEHGEFRVIDRIKEMVRLAGGLDRRGHLDDEVRQRAIACLRRFGQRVNQIPPQQVRAVGTQTFRKLRRRGAFMGEVEQALGLPVEIIAGREEARLVYLGVLNNSPGASNNRLVIDIGGGSTELVIGKGHETLLTESIQYGCVVVAQRYFGKGRVTAKKWRKAVAGTRGDLQEIAPNFTDLGFVEALGASGTARTIRNVCQAAGWCEQAITGDALERLSSEIVRQGEIDKLSLQGLSDRRRAIFPGGVAILQALFESLQIETMAVSEGALREGLLADMAGRLDRRDPRDATIAAFATRYAIDSVQAERVGRTALTLFDRVANAWGLKPQHRSLLAWVARVHEAGLAIAHSHYQRHTAYLLRESDLAGFSLLEQRFMAILGHFHRRGIPRDWHDGLPERLHAPAARCLALLRLAVLLHRSRGRTNLPALGAAARNTTLTLQLPAAWLVAQPLTEQDLDHEQSAWKPLNLKLLLEPVEAEAVTTALEQA